MARVAMLLLLAPAFACTLDALRAELRASPPEQVRALLPCLTEVATPEDAAAVSAVLGPPGTGATPVPPPDAGDVWFDGVVTAMRPSRGTLFQQTDAAGAVVQSAWLAPEDPLPAYVDVRGLARRGKLGPGAILFGTTGAAAFLSGVAVAATGLDRCATTGDCAQRDIGLGLMGGGVLLLGGGVVAIRVGF
jgi:hypothetical protein